MPHQDHLAQLEAYKRKYSPHEDRTEFMVEVEYKVIRMDGLQADNLMGVAYKYFCNTEFHKVILC